MQKINGNGSTNPFYTLNTMKNVFSDDHFVPDTGVFIAEYHQFWKPLRAMTMAIMTINGRLNWQSSM